jgi:hypothetical protein
MILMVQRTPIEPDEERVSSSTPPPRALRSVASWPIVEWVHEGPVCVTIIDEPRQAHESACRCGGCVAARQPDCADDFLPD